jgi:hypothetical protein
MLDFLQSIESGDSSTIFIDVSIPGTSYSSMMLYIDMADLIYNKRNQVLFGLNWHENTLAQ